MKVLLILLGGGSLLLIVMLGLAMFGIAFMMLVLMGQLAGEDTSSDGDWDDPGSPEGPVGPKLTGFGRRILRRIRIRKEPRVTAPATRERHV